jgi:hypothetical protein
MNKAEAVCPSGAQSCSSGYQVDQTFFGSGGQIEACSTQYCSKQTLGELAVGETSSLTYRAYAGFNTTDAPYIEFVVTAANIDIGTLDTAQATTTTGQFYVRAWQASGYVVRTESVPPTNQSNNYQMNTLSTAAASSPGTEQFGINLVKNTNFCGVSCDVGSDPAQVPDNTFSFGQVEGGYNTDGLFQYNQGDAVSRSTQSSSVTIYTISYLYNISNTTPSGRYVFTHNLVATGTY